MRLMPLQASFAVGFCELCGKMAWDGDAVSFDVFVIIRSWLRGIRSLFEWL